MSHLSPGLISAYNSLTDKHLAGYFSNTRIRRHLHRAGLITRSGRIVPEKEYRHKLMQRAHQRHVRECLAQAIFHKVLEMERVHQIEIKRRLEEFARRERVHKIKVDRCKRYEEDIIRILSPRPPTGARAIRKQHSGPEGEHSESSESPGSSRPNTAPGKMQRPVRLKPIHSNSTTASLRRSSPYRPLDSSNENDQPFNCTMESRRRLNTKEASRDISPYCLPVINNFVTPVPPTTKRKERGVKVNASGMLRGRRLRPTTASSGADVNEDPPMLRSSVHQSRVAVNMTYFGKSVHLSHDLSDMRDEVKVFQQHCGGENLCVYKGMLREGETFQFISRRHRGYPFSLTFFLNGLQVERLSSCCEFKHRKGSRLGGRHGHFGFSHVERASPCYKCIIAMGLDKKPTPPPKRVREDGGREESLISLKDAPELNTERDGEDAASHSEGETSQQQDVETHVKEETAAVEDKVRDDYEEDFEADDEGPVEDGEAKEKKSSSPSSETQREVKERDASETEDDEKDEDIKSRSGSSSPGSEQEESETEAVKDPREDEKAEQPQEVDQEETAVPLDETDPTTETEAAATKDSDIHNSAGDSTEIDISDTNISSGNKQSDDTSGDREVEKIVDCEQEEEPERAKSVQEKLAEAILKESHCSSEPELSDTSTEEEEDSASKASAQDNKDAVPENSVACTEQQQTLAEETKCEVEDVGGEAEVLVPDPEETSDPKEQEVETEQEPQKNSEEKVKTDEEDEKAASEENTTENNKSEDTALPPVSEEEMAEDEKTSEPQEDAAVKHTGAAEKDEEEPEVEAEVQPDETGQGAKTSEEDESSVSEPNKKTDETAAADNAEAEAMTASETMEMKAEPSEEREALDCEEAPVTDTEERQQDDSEDRAASETEVTAENSSSSLEGSGDTTVEKTAKTTGDNAKDDSSKDDIKEEEAEEVSAAEAKVDNKQQERCDEGEEQTEKSVKLDSKVEEKCEEEGKEEEKQTDPVETTEGHSCEESKADDEDKTLGEENGETKIVERVEDEENTSELTKSDSNTEGKANEQAESTRDGEVAVEQREVESEKREKYEDSECVKNENGEQESEEKAAATDATNEGERVSEPNTAADEGKDDELEKDPDENNAEQSEAAKNEDDEESEEKKVASDETAAGEIAEEPEKNAEADLDKDHAKISDGNIVESEDVGDGGAANAADEPEATPNSGMEGEDVTKDAEKGGDNNDNGEIDAENGEISTGAEIKTHDDEGEAQTDGKNDAKTEEETENEIKTEEDESTEVEEVTEESGDGAEKHEDNKVDQGSDTDVAESEAKEGNEGVEKQDELTENNCVPETSGTEAKEGSKSDDRKEGEERKQDENGNISDPDHENRETGVIKMNDNLQGNNNEGIVASPSDQGQSLTPPAESSEPSKTDKHPQVGENTSAIDLSAAADGENGDTEEASKASEEGASVLLKPQAQPSLLSENNKVENPEEGGAVGKETPEALATEDSKELVKNWVTMHQKSKFFETFVEPLEDFKESEAKVSNSDEEATQPTEPQRSESPLKMVKMSENTEKEQTVRDINEANDETEEDAVESSHTEDAEKDPVKDAEETEVKGLIPEAESEQNNKESVEGRDLEENKESEGSHKEDQVQEGLAENTEEIDIVKTEVESIAGTHHSVTSGRRESVSENQAEEKTTDGPNEPDLNENQTTVEEIKDLPPSSETEEHHEHSTGPEGLSELKTNELKETEEMWERSREATEITEFTEDGSHEESPPEETPPKPSDESIGGDRRGVQLIQDIPHTLSKDRLSTFSVDETLFGRSSHPLLTAARTESGH